MAWLAEVMVESGFLVFSIKKGLGLFYPLPGDCRWLSRLLLALDGTLKGLVGGGGGV
jgi:hypothetical protein